MEKFRKYSLIIILIIVFLIFTFVFAVLYNWKSPVLSVMFLEFSRDGNQIVSAPTTYIWDCDSGKVISDYYTGTRLAYPFRVSFSPDNNYVAISSNVKLIDRKKGTSVFTYSGYEAAFSNDGKSLIFIAEDSSTEAHKLATYNIADNKIAGKQPLWKTEEYNQMRVHILRNQNSRNLAAVYNDSDLSENQQPGKIEIWDIDNQKLEKRINLKEGILFMESDGDNLIIALKTEEEEKMLEMNWVDMQRKETLIGRKNKANILAISPDGCKIAFGYFSDKKDKHCIGIMEIASKNVISVIPEWSGNIRSGIAFSPDNETIAIGTMYNYPHNGEIRLFDVATGKHKKTLHPPVKILKTLTKMGEVFLNK